MVERQLPKLHTRVRSPSPAPVRSGLFEPLKPPSTSAISMLIRKFQTTDYASLRSIIEQDPDVDTHTHYTYWVASALYSETFLVAEIDGVVVGYVFGIAPSNDDKRAFLWQVAVSGQHRGHGIAKALITEFVRQCQYRQITDIALTISPGNSASKKLFESVARIFDSQLVLVGATGDMDGQMKGEEIFRLAISVLR